MTEHETTDEYWERKRLEREIDERQAEKDQALNDWNEDYDRRKEVRLHAELYEKQDR